MHWVFTGSDVNSDTRNSRVAVFILIAVNQYTPRSLLYLDGLTQSGNRQIARIHDGAQDDHRRKDARAIGPRVVVFGKDVRVALSVLVTEQTIRCAALGLFA